MTFPVFFPPAKQNAGGDERIIAGLTLILYRKFYRDDARRVQSANYADFRRLKFKENRVALRADISFISSLFFCGNLRNLRIEFFFALRA